MEALTRHLLLANDHRPMIFEDKQILGDFWCHHTRGSLYDHNLLVIIAVGGLLISFWLRQVLLNELIL